MPNRNQFKTIEEYKNWYRAYWEKNKEKIRAYKRKYNKEYRQLHGYKNEANSKQRYPEKQYARDQLRYAVKKGRVTKMSCVVCDSEYSEAHHPDYTKSLDVIWYCKIHHTEVHRSYVT